MKNQSNTDKNRQSGAALIIVLGFLALLTLMMITYSAFIRTERRAGNAYLSTAQTRHLLHTALSRALEDIDQQTADQRYPEFLAIASPEGTPLDSSLRKSLNFKMEQAYIPMGNVALSNAYRQAFSHAKWQTVTSKGVPFGRIGYLVINTSGLLDANSVGGQTKGRYNTRNTGLSPAEIQLSKTLLPEFNRTSAYFPRLYSSGRINKELAASDPDLSPALAFVYNRQNAWRHFESLRDVSLLNHIAEPNIFSSPLSSFCTFSYTPPGDSRTFMGQTAETLNREFITATLNKIPAIPDSSFVLNQLYDYVDRNTVPEDHEGNYTDQSVEPTPLINELALTCTFALTPTLINEGNDESTLHVTISHTYEVSLEVWYPFTGYTNHNTFSIHIPHPPTETGTLPYTLFGNIREWAGSHTLPEILTRPRSLPYIYPIQQAVYEIEVPDESEFLALFESLQSTIRFPSIQCVMNGDKLVDRVTNLELFLEHTVGTLLMPKVTELSDYLFDAKNNGLTTNLVFTAGRSVIDPRLNWEGTNLNQWVKTDDLNNRTSLGRQNQAIIHNQVNSPDQTQMLYIRNKGRIDTPYEFTTFLYDIAKPWKTFQFIEENDRDVERHDKERTARSGERLFASEKNCTTASPSRVDELSCGISC
jgi:hypothetical protein